MQQLLSTVPPDGGHNVGEQTVDEQIDQLIEREGGFSANPADHGGATRFGITETVARAHGYAGRMAAFPREDAVAIYRRLYWLRPRFDEVAMRAPGLAASCSTRVPTWVRPSRSRSCSAC